MLSQFTPLVDGVLRGTDSTAPYSLSLPSGKLGSGSHSLVAVAYDKAANAGQSSPVAFGVKTKLTKTTSSTLLLATSSTESSPSPTSPKLREGRRARANAID